MVKDRNHQNKLLLCVNKASYFQWKMMPNSGISFLLRSRFVLLRVVCNSSEGMVTCVRYSFFSHPGNSYGNYFDPAKDCSSILNNIPNAVTGLYWIKTNNGPKKVAKISRISIRILSYA